MDNTGSPLESHTETTTHHTSRPSSVTILALGVLIIAGINLIRLILSIKYWNFLTSWPGISPLYTTLTGLIWAFLCSLLFWGLWTAKKWVPQLMQAVALTYALYYWLDHVFLMGHPTSGVAGAQRIFLPVNWRFAAGLTVICLAFTAWTLQRSKVKMYFGLVESISTENQTDQHDDEKLL
jgi:hypothetical protein